jgi:glycosyltransferase involved in cell wall biosynthesis
MDFELIIVDDCSTDNSRNVISNYSDSRIRAFFLEQNQGMGMAFNFAVKQAKGKYLARIDSDDFWRLDKLQKQFDYMEVHPETGVCFSWVNLIDEDEKQIPSYVCDRGELFAAKNRSQSEWLHYFYFKGCCVCHTSAFIRSDALENVGIYNYSLKQIQDLELWVRIAKKYPLHVICEPLVYYRWLSTASNVSAPTQEVVTRGMFEFFYLLSDFHNGLSNEVFVQAFRTEFAQPDASTHNELLCERALLMLKQPYLGSPSKIIALLMLNKLFQDDVTREILYSKYNFTIMDYNKLCSEKLFFEPHPSLNSTRDAVNSSEVTLKNLIKKHMKKRPRLFHFAKRLYHIIK